MQLRDFVVIQPQQFFEYLRVVLAEQRSRRPYPAALLRVQTERDPRDPSRAGNRMILYLYESPRLDLRARRELLGRQDLGDGNAGRRQHRDDVVGVSGGA